MFRPLHLDDFANEARMLLARDIFDYIDGWAEDGITYRANRADFETIRIRPRVMQDVSSIDVRGTFLGRPAAAPLGFSPTAFHELVHPDGELGTAAAAAELGVPMIVSCMSNRSLEAIASSVPGARLWLHTYLFRDREITYELVARAEEAGFEAISVGLGCPTVGRRWANIRNEFALPRGLTAANFSSRDPDNFNNPIAALSRAELDPSVTWADLSALCQRTSLPVVGKGILNELDVPAAIGSGVQGLVVSNHGGRQLDGSVSAIEALPSVAATAAERVPVYLDGGVRRGTDILKALALGAQGVFLGRPVLWALSAGGPSSVVKAGRILIDEFATALQLAGCASAAAVSPAHLACRAIG